jgi:hypothetical protein
VIESEGQLDLRRLATGAGSLRDPFCVPKGRQIIGKKRGWASRRETGPTKPLEEDVVPGFVVRLDPHEVR